MVPGGTVIGVYLVLVRKILDRSDANMVLDRVIRNHLCSTLRIHVSLSCGGFDHKQSDLTTNRPFAHATTSSTAETEAGGNVQLLPFSRLTLGTRGSGLAAMTSNSGSVAIS